MSAATAAVVVLFLLPGIQGGTEDGSEPQQVEIRVMVNEVRSAPGYAVSVDTYNDNAPVIYIHPNEGSGDSAPDEDEQPHAPFTDPI